MKRLGKASMVILTLASTSASASEVDAPLLEYERTPTSLADAKRGSKIRIWTDGRIEVSIPRYMKGAGLWDGRVDPAAVHHLLDRLVTSGLTEVDSATLFQRRQAALRARTANARAQGRPLRLPVTHGADISRLKINVVRGPQALEAEWQWRGLHQDARRFSDLRALVAFGEAEQELLGWMRGPHLTKREESR